MSATFSWYLWSSQTLIDVCFVRMLEEGKVDEAEKKKDEIENKQRDRRKVMAKKGEEHIPRFFRLAMSYKELFFTSKHKKWSIRFMLQKKH